MSTTGALGHHFLTGRLDLGELSRTERLLTKWCMRPSATSATGTT